MKSRKMWNNRSHTMGSALLAALALASSPVAADSGRAQAAPLDDESSARRLYQAGMRHFNIGEYDEAIAKFRAGYRNFPAAAFLYNIAQSFRLKQDCGSAAFFYKNYLRLIPEDPNREVIEGQLRDMEQCAQEKASLDVGGKEGENRPQLETSLEELTEDDVSHFEEDSSGPRQLSSQSRAISPLRPPPSAPQPVEQPLQVVDMDSGADNRGLRIAGLSTTGVGLALLVGSVYFARRSQNATEEVDRAFREQREWTTALSRTEERGQDSEIASWALLGTGSAAIIGGTVMYFLGRPTETSAGDVSVAFGSKKAIARYSVTF